jgi:hypothetical protein
MVSDYSDYSTQNAIRIVEALLKAGKPQMITAALLDHRSAESVEAELAAAPTRAPAAASASTADQLRTVIEKRFRTQNARRAS